jgi:glycosyltransferase involved in cell wall biosynthesis
MMAPIATMAYRVRRSLIETCLSANAKLVRQSLGGQSGHRIFDRVVIVAALGRQNGIARGAFLQWEAMRRSGINVELLDATSALRNPLFRIKHNPASVYIFHSAGPQTSSLISSVLPNVAKTYRIGYWAWEMPDPPEDWAGCDEILDEIWTPSRFSRDSLAQLLTKPVEVVPHYLLPRAARTRNKKGPFTVLAMADTRSSFSRKNPAGALQAFTEAFGDSPAAKLILKLSGRDSEINAFEAALGSALSLRNVEVLRNYVDERGISALYDRADVLLSLHRAEGFGLPMLEALARGIPVVGTGWSGNLDFLDTSNSVLIPYRLVPVKDQSGIYRNSTWAEPDLAAAAAGLRLLADDEKLYNDMAVAAHATVAATALPSFPLTTVTRTDA